ncbi:hypothetical protein L195_g050762 [Trifolium pratense]|uniref:Uncharacterized protein n=1 Tax=Trifolium pratense TaxID=57577 RepID=A0A2K3JVV5_TRIPR|nr:hypothetical protein L195_g050762 [Trifolium pratense]
MISERCPKDEDDYASDDDSNFVFATYQEDHEIGDSNQDDQPITIEGGSIKIGEVDGFISVSYSKSVSKHVTFF